MYLPKTFYRCYSYQNMPRIWIDHTHSYLDTHRTILAPEKGRYLN